MRRNLPPLPMHKSAQMEAATGHWLSHARKLPNEPISAGRKLKQNHLPPCGAGWQRWDRGERLVPGPQLWTGADCRSARWLPTALQRPGAQGCTGMHKSAPQPPLLNEPISAAIQLKQNHLCRTERGRPAAFALHLFPEYLAISPLSRRPPASDLRIQSE